MNLESMMPLETMLIIVLVIAAVGTLTSQVFRNAGSPYLLTISGTRTELVVTGVLLWALAITLGVSALFATTAVASSIVGLAVFFGVEAVALDICANRTRYIRTEQPIAQRVRVTQQHRP